MYIYNTISVPRESRGPHIDKLALPEKLSVSGSGRNSAARLSLAGPACLHQQRVYGDEEVTSALPRGIGGRGKMMAASRARRFALTTQEPVSRVVNASSSVFDGVRPPMELPGPPTLCARYKEKGNARRSERRCDCECAGGGAPYHIWGAWEREAAEAHAPMATRSPKHRGRGGCCAKEWAVAMPIAGRLEHAPASEARVARGRERREQKIGARLRRSSAA